MDSKDYGEDVWNYAFYSANGKMLPNFDHLLPQVLEFIKPLREQCPDMDYIILDGEMVAENFSHVMTQLRRIKDVDPSIFKYWVFDMPSVEDTLRVRLNHLNQCKDAEQVKILQHQKVTLIPGYHAAHTIDQIGRIAIIRGEEGVVFKGLDSYYKGGHQLEWFKIKKRNTIDCQVLAGTEGTGKHKGKLGSFTCALEDHQFQVGTGFTDSQRATFWNELQDGTMKLPIIEIDYMELTTAGVPRHPVFIRIREDK